jgi:hypothetical protein
MTTSKPLPSEVDDRKTETAVRRAAVAQFGRQSRNRRFDTLFEHGRWWLIIRYLNSDEPDETYSVVDCQDGRGGADYFGFEQV